MHSQESRSIIDLTATEWSDTHEEPHLDYDWPSIDVDTGSYADVGSYEYTYAGTDVMSQEYTPFTFWYAGKRYLLYGE